MNDEWTLEEAVGNLTAALLQLNSQYRELYDQHQSLIAGHAAVNRVARTLHAELEQEKRRSQDLLLYILHLRRYLSDEHGIHISQLPLD